MQNRIKTQLRLPVEMMDWVRARAKNNLRSMNSEIIILMQKEKNKEEGLNKAI